MITTIFRFILLAGLLVMGLAEASPVRVCVIGDSISAGFAPATHGWSVPLSALNASRDWSIKNVAHSGDKVAAARLLFDSEVVGKGCTWVAILIGTNNLPDGTSAADIYAVIDGMARDAEDLGMRVLLIGLQPRGTGASWSTDLGTRLLALNALLAARLGSVYVDGYTPVLEPASNPPALASACGPGDGLHPDDECQAILAATIQAAVVAAGGW